MSGAEQEQDGSKAQWSGERATLPLPPPHIAALLTDAHCHPTDEPRLRRAPTQDGNGGAALTSMDDIFRALRDHPLRNICVMSSSLDDQHLVRDLADRAKADTSSQGANIVPAFGHHPWFVHRISLHDPPLPKEEHYLDIFAGAHDSEEHASLAWASPPPSKTSASKPEAPPSAADKNRSEELAELIKYLPEPVALSQVLRDLRANLEAHPNALLGEVGLDRSFRIPWPAEARAARAEAAKQLDASDTGDDEAEQKNTESVTPRNERRKSSFASRLALTLTSLTTPLVHQLAVLQAQLCVAVDLRRSVSFHSVKAQGATADFFMHMTRLRPRGWGPGFVDIKVDLHSCTISAPGIVQIQKTHQNIFVSFSTTINTRQKALLEQIRVCDPQRLLVESDYNSALPYLEGERRRGSASSNHEDDHSGSHDEQGGDLDDDALEGGKALLVEYPLARRTWAIVCRMAEVLDVRRGVGPECGTLYIGGGEGKVKRRQRNDHAEDETGRKEDDGNPTGQDAELRQEALARLLASNWTRFLDNRSPGVNTSSSASSSTSQRNGLQPGRSKDDAPVNNGRKGQHDADEDSDSDSDDEWNPEARQAVLRQRALDQQQQKLERLALS